MIIFPAIDIMDGKPVRLLRGDFDTAEQVAEDVLTTAKQFARVGCTWVHMVDLDGSCKEAGKHRPDFTGGGAHLAESGSRRRYSHHGGYCVLPGSGRGSGHSRLRCP